MEEQEQSKPKPWDMREDETFKTFRAFCLYRDMGPERDTNKVAQVLGRKKNLRDWAAKYKWKDRAMAYDAHLDQIMRAANEKEMVERFFWQANMAKNLQKLLYTPAEALAKRYKLADNNAEQLYENETSKELFEMTCKSADKLQHAVNIERQAMGLSTEKKEISGEIKPLKIKVVFGDEEEELI